MTGAPNYRRHNSYRQSYIRRALRLVSTVISAVERYYALPAGCLVGPRRMRSVAQPRMIAMFIVRGATNLSTVEIGYAFQRDHSTVVYGLQSVQRLIAADPQCKSDIIEIAHLVALRSQPLFAPPEQKPNDLLPILPEITQQISNGAVRSDLLLGPAEAPVDGAETPFDVVASDVPERPQEARALDGRAH